MPIDTGKLANGTTPPAQADPPRFRINVGAASDRGLVRSNNQDKMSRFVTPVGEVFIVADGMGGHEGGEVAASMVIQGFERALKAPLPPGVNPEAALREACRATNQEIVARSVSGEANVQGMGSTVVIALVREDSWMVAHVGDSRAYLLQDGQLSRLTKDHSLVQRLMDSHTITEEQAAHHPQASTLTRAFGQGTDLDIEISPPRNILPGQYIILCSDGLSGYVTDADIAAAVRGLSDAREMTSRLIKQALAAGGKDNVTVQIIHFAPKPLPVPALVASGDAEERTPHRFLNRWLWIALVAIALIAGLLLGVFVLAPRLHPEPPPARTARLGYEGDLSAEVKSEIGKMKNIAPAALVAGTPAGTPAGKETGIYCRPEFHDACENVRRICENAGIQLKDLKQEPAWKSYDIVLRLGAATSNPGRR